MIIYDYIQLARQTEIDECSIRSISTLKTQLTFWFIAKPIMLLITFSYFDAIIGGGISEVLRIGGWSPFDQMVNDMYQAGFGFGVLVIIGMLLVRKTISAIFCIPLLVFYVEDVVYYFLQPLASPIIKFLIGMTTPAIRLPQEYSGWLGWIMRVILKENFTLVAAQVYLLNAIGIFILVIVSIEYQRHNKKQNE